MKRCCSRANCAAVAVVKQPLLCLAHLREYALQSEFMTDGLATVKSAFAHVRIEQRSLPKGSVEKWTRSLAAEILLDARHEITKQEEFMSAKPATEVLQ